jgi:hypothetical protein
MRIPTIVVAVCALAGLPAARAAHPFICTDSSGNAVSVVGSDGQVEWRYECTHPQDCWRLANGDYLFCFLGGARELTPAKKIVWEYMAPAQSEVNACAPLPLGRVLLVECGACRIVEVGRDGRIEKEIKLPPPPASVHVHDQYRGVRKTAASHYLVCCKAEHHVLELDPEGKILRTIPTPGDVHEALLLPDGHILIACGDGHKVVEIDQDEKVVWSLDENEIPGNPLRLMSGFQRLPNGNTIFCNYLGHGPYEGQPHVFELTRDKRVVWEFSDHQHFKTINQIQVLDVPGDAASGEILR